MDPVTGAVLVGSIPVLGLVLVVLWWRRQEGHAPSTGEPRGDGDAVGDVGEPSSLRDPARDRRRRDERQRGLGLN